MNASVVFKASSAHNIPVLSFVGSMDEDSCSMICKKVHEFCQEQQQAPGFIFDFLKLISISPGSISEVVKLHEALSQKKKQLIISSPSPSVSEILEMLGVSRAIPVFSHIDQAREYFAEETYE